MTAARTTTRIRSHLTLALGLLLLSPAWACKSTSARARAGLHGTYYRGDLAGALDVAQATLASSDPSDRSEALMERGLIYQRMGNFVAAGEDFRAADEQLEILDFTDDSFAQIASFMLTDDFTIYRGQPHEKILLNTLNILNYLEQGDLTSVKVAARRAAVMDDFQTETERLFAFDNALTPLLFGLAFEASGESEQAFVAYRTAYEKSAAPFLRPRLLSIANEHGFSDAARLRKEFGDLPPPVPKGHGTVLAVVMTGQAPIRESERCEVPEQLLNEPVGDLTMAGVDKNTIHIAALKQRSHRHLSGTAGVGGDLTPLVSAVDIEEQAMRQFEKDRPELISAAVSRYLVRYAAEAVVTKQDSQVGYLVGVLRGTMAELDEPDTRCWSLLPAEIMVNLLPAPAGAQEVVVQMDGAPELRRTVNVTEGGVSVAMFFVTE